ncbi:hypothetical protein CON65_13250 [Bacillus pseudomycoides]|uniref:Uncharacterized protein n=1 Tax=Bacillus pseudomycoides TaxID=64104 RepID=A0AA91VBR5_9BACI|nr:hypothetical protein COO03_02005 [Bacillus sp. AFS098217]PED82177.1 hypothetical protein CON65_13250 [Bacillus pseudomycoides]PEU17941.1 hypothetical protein CN524_00590 [Bacillus sp. AFS019443]PEU19904.1 hypothetical protein CN525_05485 [Bacillus sp. AFS014408]PFW60499.1 hypothetical protein COL20_21745 [Bacillus sp. AFS075034]
MLIIQLILTYLLLNTRIGLVLVTNEFVAMIS